MIMGEIVAQLCRKISADPIPLEGWQAETEWPMRVCLAKSAVASGVVSERDYGAGHAALGHCLRFYSDPLQKISTTLLFLFGLFFFRYGHGA